MALLRQASEYLRVEGISLTGKYHIAFNVVSYIKHPLTEELVRVSTEYSECKYNLDGPNVYEQCYESIKETHTGILLEDC